MHWYITFSLECFVDETDRILVGRCKVNRHVHILDGNFIIVQSVHGLPFCVRLRIFYFQILPLKIVLVGGFNWERLKPPIRSNVNHCKERYYKNPANLSVLLTTSPTYHVLLPTNCP